MLEVQKRPREAIARLRVWVAIEVSLSRQSFLTLCHDMVLYVATWFLGRRRLLGGDKDFPGRDKVAFFWFSVAIRVLPMLRHCFILCHDNVAAEGPLSRLRRPWQEVRVTIGAWLRPRNFRSR